MKVSLDVLLYSIGILDDCEFQIKKNITMNLKLK